MSIHNTLPIRKIALQNELDFSFKVKPVAQLDSEQLSFKALLLLGKLKLS